MKIQDFTSNNEVHEFVRAFEACEISPSEFKHCAHIAVALSYIKEMPLEDATNKMRSSLLNFLRHHNVNHDVYNETQTVFWMKLLNHLSSTQYSSPNLYECINSIVKSRYASKMPIEAHYSEATIRSKDAREHWVAPDLLPTPF